MLQLNFIRENKDLVVKRLKIKNFDASVIIEEIIKLDNNRRATQKNLDDHLAKSNLLAKEIGRLFKEGKREEAEKVRKESTEMKTLAKELEQSLNNIEKELSEKLVELPNVPHESVPPGKSDADNELVYEEGTLPQLADNALPHWELASKYDIIDFDLGSKVTGAGFPFYKGQGARLQRALINFFLDTNRQKGFEELCVPFLNNAAMLQGTGQLPKFEDDLFKIEDENLYLIPTAEVPLTNLYHDEILSEKELPVLMTGYTPCFRREAGSAGRDTRGMIRQHQFDKVEMVAIAHPDKSDEVFEMMVQNASDILTALGLPHRVMALCGGDLGFSAAKTIDLEVWLPGQNKYREISSISTTGDFQARRAKIRFKEGKKNRLVHTLNGSALAVGRTLVAIMENYQNEDGSIEIPEVLKKYM